MYMPYYPPQPPPYGIIPPEELQKQAERSALKKRGIGIGLALVGMLAVSSVVSSIGYAVLMLFAQTDFQNGSEAFLYMAPTVYYLFYMVLYLMMVVLPFAVLIPIFHLRLRDIYPLRRTGRPGLVLLACIGGLAVCMISNYLTSEYVMVLESFGIGDASSALPLDNSPAGKVMYLIIVAVLPAFAEEFAFRGVAFQLLRPYGKTLAIFGSAFVFGIMHGNLVQIPFAFVVGLFFGYVVAETGSIWPAVLMHFLNNGFSVLQEFALEGLSETASMHMVYLSYILVTLIGLLALVCVLRQDRHFFRVQEDCTTRLGNKDKFRAFVGNVGMILAFVALGIEVLASINWSVVYG